MKTFWKLCVDPHPSLSFIMKWKSSPQKVSWWRWMDVFYKMSWAGQKHIAARAAPENTKLVFFCERLILIFKEHECLNVCKFSAIPEPWPGYMYNVIHLWCMIYEVEYISMYDPWSWYMCVWGHICMIDTYLNLIPDLIHACIYDEYIYDEANLSPMGGPINKQILWARCNSF